MAPPASNAATLARVHALAFAAMASVASPPPPAVAAAPPPQTCLEMAWLKSVGRIPGQLPPPGGWGSLAAAAGYRPTAACLGPSTGGPRRAAPRP